MLYSYQKRDVGIPFLQKQAWFLTSVTVCRLLGSLIGVDWMQPAKIDNYMLLQSEAPSNQRIFLVEQQPHLLFLPGKDRNIYHHHLNKKRTVWKWSRKNECYFSVSFGVHMPSVNDLSIPHHLLLAFGRDCELYESVLAFAWTREESAWWSLTCYYLNMLWLD